MGGLKRIRTLGLSALLLSGVAAAGMGVGLAQDTEVPAHPAHIHAGTCDDLDPNPKAPLSYVSILQNEGDDPEANSPQGVLTADRVLLSVTEGVELSMEDILAESHSINIHLSDQEIDTYIACGEIGGVSVEGDLYVGLHDVNGSGYNGVAKLSADDDATNVEIYLTEPTDESAPATPVA